MTIEQKRAAFEAWYVEHFKEHTGREDFTLEVMQSMRGLHNDYRENAYLHGLWIGYQAALESPEVQASRKDAERYRFIRPGDAMVWCSSGDYPLENENLDAAIDAAMEAVK